MFGNPRKLQYFNQAKCEGIPLGVAVSFVTPVLLD